LIASIAKKPGADGEATPPGFLFCGELVMGSADDGIEGGRRVPNWC